MKSAACILFIVFGFALDALYAQSDTVVNDTLKFSQVTENAEETRHFYFLPIIYWTPQTKLGGGMGVTYVFSRSKEQAASRPTTLYTSLIYTQKKQIITTLGSDYFWDRNRSRLGSNLLYSKYPDAFYGIGPHTPDSSGENMTPQTFGVMMNYTRKISRALYLGAVYEFDAYRVIKTEANSRYDNFFQPYRRFLYTSGLGVSVNWDSRDYSLYPRRGWYCQNTLVPFHSLIGSGFDFIRYRIDARKYFTFFENHVLAAQFYGQWITGEAPVNKIAEFGGLYITRGYYLGRYKDRQMIAAQAEYRMPVYWRFGLTAFAGAGEVARNPDGFSFRPLKYSLGYGIRFLMNEETRVNLRLDFAWGHDSFSWFIAIGEAF